MKTIKQRTQEEVQKFHKRFGYDSQLREVIKRSMKEQDTTELWQLEDAIADFKVKFNPYTNE